MAVVWKVDVRGQPLAALTFDDGPSPMTDRLLDLLAAHGARATFFVLGHAIAGHEPVLERAVREGHELGNHTWSHARADELGDDELEREIARTSELVEAATGVRPALMRPPYGRDPERVARIAARLGLAPTVLWSIDPSDWTGTAADQIVRVVVTQMQPGAIVDLHDGRRGREATVEAVGRILGTCGADGYRFVTVTELLAAAS
jgi:peptidoglycan-N-acetylglucosamine deacetylase